MENELTIYGSFIKEIKELIYRRQYEAMKKVNTELMLLYWEIGEEIDRKQREQGWGKSVVEILAKELQKEFPAVQGFSSRNLWLMRSFFLEYSQCKNKKRTKVEYTLRKSNAPIGVATYSYHDNLPEDMRGLLPTPDEIATIIAEIDGEKNYE